MPYFGAYFGNYFGGSGFPPALSGGSEILVDPAVQNPYSRMDELEDVNPGTGIARRTGTLVTFGAIVDADLSGNVAFRNAVNTFTQRQLIVGDFSGITALTIQSTNVSSPQAYDFKFFGGSNKQLAIFDSGSGAAGVGFYKIGDTNPTFLVTTGARTITANAAATFISTGAAVVPLASRGFAGQTGNLYEWQDNTGAALASMNNLGQLQANAVNAGGAASALCVTAQTAVIADEFRRRQVNSTMTFNIDMQGTVGGTAAKFKHVGTGNNTTSGTNIFTSINPTYNNVGATGIINYDFVVDRTETNLGTTPGGQYLMDLRVAGVSKLSATSAGMLTGINCTFTGTSVFNASDQVNSPAIRAISAISPITTPSNILRLSQTVSAYSVDYDFYTDNQKRLHVVGTSGNSGFIWGGNNIAVDKLRLDSNGLVFITPLADSSSAPGGNTNALNYVRTYTQTGTADSRDWVLNRIETSLGTGVQRSLEFQRNSSAVSYFKSDGSLMVGAVEVGGKLGVFASGVGACAVFQINNPTASATMLSLAHGGTTPTNLSAWGCAANASDTLDSLLQNGDPAGSVRQIHRLLAGSGDAYSLWTKNGATSYSAGYDQSVDSFVISRAIGLGASNVLSINASNNATFAGGVAGTTATFSGAATIGGGTPIQKPISVTAVLDFPSISAQSSDTLTVSVTGAAVGDTVVVSPPAVNAFATAVTGWVSAADTVTVRYHNYSSAAVDPASGTYRVTVIKF